MEVLSEKVVVEYKTKKTFCHCCGQTIENPKTSQARSFSFTRNDCLEWLDQEYWNSEAEDEGELNRLVDEFVYDTIDFFATSSDEMVIVEKDELEKVKAFILKEVVA
jgi:hypothetical protein